MIDDEETRRMRYEDALEEIRKWCRAYPEEMFPPLRQGDMTKAYDARKAVGIDMFHGGWARHLLSGIGRIASKALDE